MNTRVYVENLAASTTASDLIILFSTFGNVVDANVTVDRNQLGSSTCGCVTMVTPEGARAAILELHGKQMDARTLAVSGVCLPRTDPANAPAPPKLSER
jgi:RNA recognition motif-containing protein